jgi:hypothetical protein
MNNNRLFPLIGVFVLLIIFLCQLTYAIRNVNSDNNITVDIGAYHVPIKINIMETYVLKGDLFEVTRQIWFTDVNESPNVSFSYTITKNKPLIFYNYFQYDDLGKLVKHEPYIESRYVDNETSIATFPDIQIQNQSKYYVKEIYNMKFENWHQKDIWFPFDSFPYNSTLDFRTITYSYDLEIDLPKTYDAYYNNNNSFAIESYYGDSTFFNMSKGPGIIWTTCIQQYRPFIRSFTADMTEIKFPTVVMPSIMDDPCHIIGPKIKIYFNIGRTNYIKGIFILTLLLLVALVVYFFINPDSFKWIIGIAVPLVLFQEGSLLFLSANRPMTLTLWDITIFIILALIIVKILPLDRFRRKDNPIRDYTG